MRIPRILVELPLGTATPVTLPPGPSRHLLQVLRLRAGDPLILFNGDGRDFPGRLLIPAKDAVRVQLDHPTEIEPPPGWRSTWESESPRVNVWTGWSKRQSSWA